MEKHYCFRLSLIMLLFSMFILKDVNSQWISGGDGSRYILDDLVLETSGVVTNVDGDYYFNSDVTISSTDTLIILENIDCIISEGLLLTFQGVLIINPPNSISITTIEEEVQFLGLRFEDSDGSIIKKTEITNCGGIKLINSDMLFDSCIIHRCSKEYASGAIDLFHSNATIQNSIFIYNDGPAITSGANAESAPNIINNEISSNNVSNENTPQINLGNSANDTIKIIGNTIIGEYYMAGGIAVSTLYGGTCQAIISGNTVEYNRYGIASIGSDIYTEIFDNVIMGNVIQGDPMLGGSGLNFYGGSTNISKVHHNVIAGNLWGITIQLNAQPNIGDISGGSNEGFNTFYQNGNGGITYHLYNNTPGDIMAENNYWAANDLEIVAGFIYDQTDDASLGLVDYDPLWVTGVGVNEIQPSQKLDIFPNPAKSEFSIAIDKSDFKGGELSIYNMNGKVVKSLSIHHQNKINIESLPKGYYFVKLIHNKSTYVNKLIVE